MNALATKIETLSTEQIKEVVNGTFEMIQDEADVVLQTALNILEKRLPENEFIEFCDSI